MSGIETISAGWIIVIVRYAWQQCSYLLLHKVVLYR